MGSFRGTRTGGRTVYDPTAETRLAELKPIISSALPLIAADDFPLISMLMELHRKEKMVGGMEWTYHYDELLSETVEANADHTKVIVTLTLTDNTHVNVGDLLLHFIQTSVEQLYVSAVDSSGADLTVTRAFGGTAHQILDGDVLINTRNVSGDGSSTPSSVTTDATDIDQYGCLQRSSIDFYGMYKAWSDHERYYPEGTMENFQKDKKLREHKLGMERKLIYGQKHKSLSSGVPTYIGMGFLEFLTTYADASQIIDCGGTLSESFFWKEIMGACQRRAVGNKVIFAGRNAVNAISYWTHDRLRFTPSSKVAGISLGSVRNPINEKDIKVIYHQHLNQLKTPEGTTEKALKDVMIIMDLDNVEYRNLLFNYTHGTDHKLCKGTAIETVPKADNVGRILHEIMTTFGVEWHDANSHAFVYNIEDYV